MKIIYRILLVVAAAVALECGADAQSADAAVASPVPDSFRDVQTIVLHDGKPAAGVPVRMMAQVAHISALADDTCVVVNPERPWEQGV